MSNLAERVASAKEHASPNWTPERERLVRAKIDVRASMRRKVRRRFAVTMALAAMIAATLVFWRRVPSSGTSVVSLRLLSGTARFSVTPNAHRRFSVLARDVTVTVLGTIFTVGLEPGGVRVTVERGRVHVAWPAGERVLRIGEEAFIPDAR